jgi:CheY-like chemotaxis protein
MSIPRRTSARGKKGKHPVITEHAVSTATIKGRGGPGDGSGECPVRRALVVEDEALICADTADTFEQQGFVVHTACSGEDALRRLRDGLCVDILFTDINLAGAMDGTALARYARELCPALIVVYTSGAVETVAHGVAGSAFVPKPYSPERVGRLLRGMCAAGSA